MYVGAALLGLEALMLIAQWIGWRMTEGAEKPVLDFKPFNCRACLTFWLTMLFLFSALALVGYDYPVTQLIEWHFFAVIFAFINYFYINSKFKVYE